MRGRSRLAESIMASTRTGDGSRRFSRDSLSGCGTSESALLKWTSLQRRVYARCSHYLREMLKAATDEQILDALAAPTDIEAIARLLLATPDPVHAHSRLEAQATAGKPAAEDGLRVGGCSAGSSVRPNMPPA